MDLVTLAIETSCDETSAAILVENEVKSNIVSSQLFHSDFGGIVPELASRAHIKSIDKISEESIKQSGINKKDINLVAYTKGPGLIGSLLVGFNYGKSFALGKKINCTGINHIESHLYSSYIGQSEIDFPFISLIVSGGHTLLVIVNDYFSHKILGQTHDDAAGEAYDKGAKMLGLPYPGGPEIDNLSKTGDDKFHKFPVSYLKDNIYDFSFSGVKTALLYFIKKNYPEFSKENKRSRIPIENICASYQKAINDSLIEKTLKASKKYEVKNITISGGVSMNSNLRKGFLKLKDSGYNIYFPKPQYTTDNAAMIGYTAYLRHKCNLLRINSIDENAFARLDYNNF